MKKKNEAGWSWNVWKDTGARLDNQKIYRSVLGNYAIETNEGYLKGITIKEAREAGCDVDKSRS